jgi:hypothetical protein
LLGFSGSTGRSAVVYVIDFNIEVLLHYNQ